MNELQQNGRLKRGYDVRTYTLTANTPQALPSAREFIVVSASDITAIQFNMGEGNGDFELWPYGFAIGVRDGSVKARILSTITQTVIIAMLDGDATVKDNRFAPGAGRLQVEGATPDGSAVIGNPVLVGGFDGTLTQTLLTDTGGRALIAARDYTGTAQPVMTDTLGRLIVAGRDSNGSPSTTFSIGIGGVDGSANRRDIRTDTTGNMIAVGAGVVAAAIVGNPVRIGASDGTNTRDVLTDAKGRLNIRPNAAASGGTTFQAAGSGAVPSGGSITATPAGGVALGDTLNARFRCKCTVAGTVQFQILDNVGAVQFTLTLVMAIGEIATWDMLPLVAGGTAGTSYRASMLSTAPFAGDGQIQMTVS